MWGGRCGDLRCVSVRWGALMGVDLPENVAKSGGGGGDGGVRVPLGCSGARHTLKRVAVCREGLGANFVCSGKERRCPPCGDRLIRKRSPTAAGLLLMVLLPQWADLKRIRQTVWGSDPDRIRTCGRQIRNLLLYPAELRDQRWLQKYYFDGKFPNCFGIFALLELFIEYSYETASPP